MILTMFAIGVLAGALFLYLGYTQYSFPLAYLGMFVFLILGLFLMSEGLQIDDAMVQTSPGIYTTTYITHTTANDPIISILANTFFYIPIAGLLLSTFFALRGWR